MFWGKERVDNLRITWNQLIVELHEWQRLREEAARLAVTE